MNDHRVEQFTAVRHRSGRGPFDGLSRINVVSISRGSRPICTFAAKPSTPSRDRACRPRLKRTASLPFALPCRLMPLAAPNPRENLLDTPKSLYNCTFTGDAG
jgi:hypothetical protein